MVTAGGVPMCVSPQLTLPHRMPANRFKALKDGFMEAVGLGPDEKERPKLPPPKGTDKKLFVIWRLLAGCALLAYFCYLLAQLIITFLAQQADPPIIFSQVVPKHGSGDPHLFAFAVCDTGRGEKVQLFDMTYSERGNFSYIKTCYPDPSVAYVDYTPLIVTFHVLTPAGNPGWQCKP